VFQDEPVKTILTRSQKPLKPVGTQTRKDASITNGPNALLAPTHSILSLNIAQRAPRRINFYRFRPNDFKSFDPLFKVLFIFPSQYLFAIGFPHIFSLRRSLSPAWCTSIKVHDSPRTCQVPSDTTDGALTLFGGSLRSTSASDKVRQALFRLQFAVQGRRLPFWAFPASVAPTEGILVSFFSSA
jgi:hypothetical protein